MYLEAEGCQPGSVEWMEQNASAETWRGLLGLPSYCTAFNIHVRWCVQVLHSDVPGRAAESGC